MARNSPLLFTSAARRARTGRSTPAYAPLLSLATLLLAPVGLDRPLIPAAFVAARRHFSAASDLSCNCVIASGSQASFERIGIIAWQEARSVGGRRTWDYSRKLLIITGFGETTKCSDEAGGSSVVLRASVVHRECSAGRTPCQPPIIRPRAPVGGRRSASPALRTV